jgi:hypothetical protein
MNFRVKFSLTGRDSYGAGVEWHESTHDDLVLALLYREQPHPCVHILWTRALTRVYTSRLAGCRTRTTGADAG